ncbi:hypothetical protein [Hymenobacter sp. AT01-02]|uniref:hypothetical protein n=1 Tax=Hymenobacter sp. AT01-02 TaxID=1571877 RepID=UPI0005F15AE1|nr:hypothetical protein [Hymenobacter sp. AT01-02]
MNKLLSRLRPQDAFQRLFIGFVLMLVGGGAVAALLETPLALVPAVLVVGALIVFIEWRLIYYLLFLTLAFSREIGVGGGLS